MVPAFIGISTRTLLFLLVYVIQVHIFSLMEFIYAVFQTKDTGPNHNISILNLAYEYEEKGQIL